MAWKIIPGLKGRVYVPEEQKKTPKKHGCRECFSCQMCSDDRCRLCGDIKCAEKQLLETACAACGVSEKSPDNPDACNG